MEIQIDQEFKDLIAPQSAEENASLEQSILCDGFNEAYPLIVWKDHDILVDGHHRYAICQKYDIEFKVIEKEFTSREEIINWMVDNQLSRRNIDPNTRAYLIGRKHNLEKQSRGGAKGNSCTLRTDEKLAKEFNTSPRTVKNYSEYYKSVEKVCDTSAISRSELMQKATIKDVNALAKMNGLAREEAIEKIKEGEPINYKIEGVFPVYLKLDKETNNRLKFLSSGKTPQDFLSWLINYEYDRINA